MQNDLYLSENPALSEAATGAAQAVLALVDPLPRIPTLAATCLQLELLLQESLLDLKAVSDVILSDAGATLQMLRLIGEEYPNEEDRPTRIEDCIVSLNSECWYEAICASGVSHCTALIAEWQRCRRIAECARELAKCVDGFSPDEAYIVGLLYRLGTFPRLLGWSGTGDSSPEHRALGVMLADYWHLPGYLITAIQEQQDALASTRWGELLELATQLVQPT